MRDDLQEARAKERRRWWRLPRGASLVAVAEARKVEGSEQGGGRAEVFAVLINND